MLNFFKFGLILNFVFINNLYSLDIDEKLTLRFLKVSNSKKTVLVNRGAEDGLVVGDHAKFFITSGIVARGLVEKVSPSRSIWSLYRVVSPEDIVDNKVLNIKIATPVKVTGDPTKSMADENTIEGSDKISVPKEMDEDLKNKDALDDSELADLKESKVTSNNTKQPKHNKAEESIEVENIPVAHSIDSSKKWEMFGGLNFNSLSGTDSRNAQVSGSTSAASSIIDLKVGIERYFLDSSFKNISIYGLLNKKSMETGSNAKTTTDWLMYGGGVNYYFYNHPNQYNKLIAFGLLEYGRGTVSVKEKTVNTTTGTATETPYTGLVSYYSIGCGAKYILSNGFGLKGTLDYFSSSEVYVFDTGTSAKRTLSGPRVGLNFLYRF